jgi:hypothetical protein
MARHGEARSCGDAQAPGRDAIAAGAAGTPSLARRGALGNHGGALALRLARLRRLGLAPGPAALVATLAWGAADG